ncbi:MAG: hypothetical protein ACLFQE_06065 [Thermotogota bacterium]
MYEFLDPKRVNIFFAYLAIAFGLFSVIFAVYEGIAITNEYFQSINNGELTIPETSTLYNQQPEQMPMFFTLAGLIGFIVSLLSFLFQSLCNYQWAKVLNRNISETNRLLSDMMKKTNDQEVLYDFQWMSDKLNTLWIQLWAFLGYVAMSILGTVINNMTMLFSVFAFIFLAYYLSQIFKVSNELLRIKSQFYSFYLKEKYHEGLEYIIPYRNIIMFFIFSVLTLGIYWYYLLFKLSTEINYFLDYDEQLMIQLPDSPLIKEAENEN